MDTEKTWKDVLATIQVSVSAANFSTWFAQTFVTSTKKISAGRQLVEIACPSSFIADTIEKRYFGLIQDCLNQVTGQKNDLAFIVKQRPAKTSKSEQPLFYTPLQAQDQVTAVLKRARVSPTFTFENFAVSSINQMAHAAAEAVATSPGAAYNPLFFWGGVGVGKTHLMLAIGNQILSAQPDVAAFYCMGEEFTTEIVEAIRTKTTQAFKTRYRRLKLLLVDDVQFIAGKNTVQEEFFHTFNTIQREGGQIVLTSDRPPSEIEKLEKRLQSRFEAGFVVDIGPADFELRTAITLIKSRQRGLELDMESAQAIAANIDSPRRIEGFITKLITQARVSGDRVSSLLVNRLISSINKDVAVVKKHVSPQQLVNAVASHFSLGKRKLLGTNRSVSVALPRQILMYLLRRELSLPLQEVGRIVGGKDHTTVMYAVEKISKILPTNSGLRGDISGIKRAVWT